MNVFNFESPSRQSAKGIIVLIGVNLYKIIKGTIIVIAAFFIKYIQSDKGVDFTSPIFMLSVLAFILYLLILAILKYQNFKFHVSSDYFILRQGIINKEEVSIAKTKIQNIYIKQNLLQQVINVVSLSIETAGDDKTEIEITALSKPKANALKALLLSGNKYLETEISEEIKDIVFFKASFKRLVLEGISENHLKSFVLIFGFIVGTYRDLKDVIEQLTITNKLKTWFNLGEESFMMLLIFNISIITGMLVLAFLFSLIKTLIQNYNLTVTQKFDGLEITKGLLNKMSLRLAASRIQTTTISTNRFKRALGLHQLTFTQAMVNKKQRQKFKIIALSKRKVNELLERFYPLNMANFVMYRSDTYLIYRLVIISMIPILLLNIVFVFLPNSFFLINIPLLIAIGLNVYFIYKKKYYSIDDRYIIVGGGALITTTTSFMEITNTQAVSIEQNIFQKKKNLASLKVHSASKHLEIPHINFKTAQNIKNYLLYKVESEDKDWM